MNNLYIFAIGGTGERVMNSLVMMLAAGMPIGAQSITPVFIDNHATSYALRKCKEMISFYRTRNDHIVGLHELGTMCQQTYQVRPTFAHVQINEPITLTIAGDALKNLNEVIGVRDQGGEEWERSIREERDLLFSSEDLNMEFKSGFYGIPNLGSVALYSTILEENGSPFSGIHIGEDDGVFIIGSLFGGTGAAGFPLIANTYDKEKGNKPIIGGVAVLPYFNAIRTNEDNDGPTIYTDSFDSKTRAALAYYNDYMKHVDYLYYVGNANEPSTYPYDNGDENDQAANPYNLIEVMAALSAIDFSYEKSHPQSQVFRIPVWGFVDENTRLSNLSGVPNQDLKKTLAKFQMMKVIIENPNYITESIRNRYPFVRDISFEQNLLRQIVEFSKDNPNANEPTVNGLAYFLKEWDVWMSQLNDDTITRHISIFDQTSLREIRAEEITTRFHTTSKKHGIAKEISKTTGIFDRRVSVEPMNPEVNKAIQNAYTRLIHGRPDNAARFAVPTLILEISLALDFVIENKCDL